MDDRFLVWGEIEWGQWRPTWDGRFRFGVAMAIESVSETQAVIHQKIYTQTETLEVDHE